MAHEIPSLCSFSACLEHRSFQIDCRNEYIADLIIFVAMIVEWWSMPELRRRAKTYDGIYPVASDAMGEGKIEPYIAEGAVRILLKSKFVLI